MHDDLTKTTGRIYQLNIIPCTLLGTLSTDGEQTVQFSRNVLLMFLTYQLLIVIYLITIAMTGDGGSGFDPGEGALETATTSKECSRRVNYSILIQGGSDNK